MHTCDPHNIAFQQQTLTGYYISCQELLVS